MKTWSLHFYNHWNQRFESLNGRFCFSYIHSYSIVEFHLLQILPFFKCLVNKKYLLLLTSIHRLLEKLHQSMFLFFIWKDQTISYELASKIFKIGTVHCNDWWDSVSEKYYTTKPKFTQHHDNSGEILSDDNLRPIFNVKIRKHCENICKIFPLHRKTQKQW